MFPIGSEKSWPEQALNTDYPRRVEDGKVGKKRTCPRRGSNSGPSDYETDVIPTTPQRPVAIETGNTTYKPPSEGPLGLGWLLHLS